MICDGGVACKSQGELDDSGGLVGDKRGAGTTDRALCEAGIWAGGWWVTTGLVDSGGVADHRCATLFPGNRDRIPEEHAGAAADTMRTAFTSGSKRGSAMHPADLPVNNMCPYCGARLVPVPSRKRKCPGCGQYVHVKRKPSDRKRYLVTDAEARAIEAEWAKEDRARADQKWADLQRRLVAAATAGNYREMSGLYFEQAWQLFDERRDHWRLLQESQRWHLRDYASGGFVKVVEVIACSRDTCAECRRLHGTRLTVEEALATMILPHKGCTTWKHSESIPGWCRCGWIAVVES